MQAEHNSLPACPLCGNPSLRPRDQRAADCPRCGLLVNLETQALDYSAGGGQAVPDPSKMAWRLENARYRFRIITPFLHGHEVFIDIGCGSGEMLEAAKAHFAQHLGFDTNAPLISYAKGRGLNAVNAAFDPASLDTEIRSKKKVFALSHVIEHLSHPMDTLRTVCDVMAPGDLLYVEVPLHTGQSFTRQGYEWSLWNAEHVALYSGPALDYIARNLGLTTFAQGTRIFARGSKSRKTFLRLMLRSPLHFLLAAFRKPPHLSMADVMVADYGFILLRK
jgi:SAM-dependent methyltransferase